MLVRFTCTAVAALAFTGCAASVNGKVDEENVPALFSAFFVQDKIDAIDPTDGTPATQFSVSASGISLFDGCNVAAKRQQAFNEAFKQLTSDTKNAQNADDLKAANEKFVDAQVAFDTKNLPSDFWTVGVFATALSENDLSRAKVDIDVKNPDPKATETALVSVCRVDDWPEKKLDKDKNASLLTHQTCFAATKGSVTVNGWTRDAKLAIVGDVDFTRVNGAPDNDAGAAKVTVGAGWCQPLEQALDDLKKLQENAATP